MACPTNIHGDFVAPELAEEQTLENLKRFADRLQLAEARMSGDPRTGFPEEDTLTLI